MIVSKERSLKIARKVDRLVSEPRFVSVCIRTSKAALGIDMLIAGVIFVPRDADLLLLSYFAANGIIKVIGSQNITDFFENSPRKIRQALRI